MPALPGEPSAESHVSPESSRVTDFRASSVNQWTALTAPIFFLPRSNMLQSIGVNYFKGKPQLQTFKDLHTKIANTYAERNKIEHATWQHVHPSMPVIKVRIAKTTAIHPEIVKLEDLQEFGQTIIKLVMELDDFMHAHIPAPSPSK
jgi:hypothetical protein